MEQRRVGIVLGITFVILGLMLQPAKAENEIEFDTPEIIKYAGEPDKTNGSFGREDAMCSALYITAVDQLAANIRDKINVKANTAGLEFYSMLARIMKWKQTKERISRSAYSSQVAFYMENLDVPTALLHYNRCWHRVNAVYAEYVIAKAKSQK